MQGWKTWSAGVGLICTALGGFLLYITGADNYTIEPERAWQLLLSGLAVLGVGHKLDKLRSAMVVLVACIVSGGMAAEISGPAQVAACSGLVRLTATADEGNVLRWLAVSPRTLDLVSIDNGRTIVFAAPHTAGIVSLAVVDVKAGEAPVIATTFHDVTIVGPVNPGPVSPTPPVPPPLPPTPPTPPTPPPVPDDLLGIARVAYVEAAKLSADDRPMIAAVADVYAGVAASIAAGTTTSLDAAITTVQRRVTEATTTARSDGWKRWRDEVDLALSELRSAGLLRTVRECQRELESVEKGLRRLVGSGSPATTNLSTLPLAIDRSSLFAVFTLGGRKYAQVKASGLVAPVQSDGTFCIDGPDGRRCYNVANPSGQ